jgi:hypothetical protein
MLISRGTPAEGVFLTEVELGDGLSGLLPTENVKLLRESIQFGAVFK